MGKRAAIIISILVTVFCSSWVSAQLGSVNRNGQAIYEEHCFRCHGMNGKGDGPDSGLQIVPPANFQSLRSRAKSDFELLTIVEYGIAFSPMHGFRGRLTDDELLDVINYIRTIAPFIPLA
jgi:mono/diheme cytochrome c family protein